jgi:hypothetical protein
MKFKLLFVLPLVILGIQAYGQQAVWSATGGLNFGKWKFDHKSDYNHARTGILLGATVDIAVQDEWSVESGLQYAMFGTHLKKHYEEATYKANYLVIPMLARYTFPIGISVHAGPEIGCLVSAHSILDGDGYNFKDEMKSFDLFLAIGAMYTLENGLSVGFRIHRGLTNVEDGASTSIHNRGVSLIAAYPISNIMK